MEKLLKAERENFRKERVDRSNDKKFYAKQILYLSQKVSELQKASNTENKENEENKSLKLRCIKLSKQNSNFEKVLFLEKEKLEKEIADFETKQKSFEIKNNKLSVKIYDLEKERKNFTGKKNLFEKENKTL